MGNIPDFVMQVQEVERQIEAQCDVTSKDWNDPVQRRFYDTYIDTYQKTFRLYIHGGTGIMGKGLNELLLFIDSKMSEMEKISGVPADLAFSVASGVLHDGTVKDNYGSSIDVENLPEVQGRGGIVHNDRLERDCWKETGPFRNGSRPGQYSSDEIEQIMEHRSKDDYNKDCVIIEDNKN
ncbi:MAG: hypothetical protein NC308_05960 [Clostridium sp.]|nr:hypothetical protein [Bacteroides sp.]MCM1198414.1 hypothetical protein [Clostridium sp.]